MSDLSHPTGIPRWRQLSLLGVVVAGVHLWLLGGEWPQWLPGNNRGEAPAPVTSPGAAPSTAARTAESAASAATAPVIPVTVSTVRWVLDAPAPPARSQTFTPPPPRQHQAAAAPRPAHPAPVMPAPGDAPPPGNSPLTATPEAPAAAEPALSAVAAPDASPPATANVVAAADTHTATPTAAASTAPAAPAAPLPPARPPDSASLAYDVTGTVKGLSYNAQGTLDWTLSGGRYEARMAVRLPLVGSRVQTSTGRSGAGGLLPERFADKARSERAAHFDHEQQRIRFSANTPDAELQPGAQDRLSLFLQLAARFNAAPDRWQGGELIEIQVVGTADAEPWRFRVGEEETLNLPAGSLRTRRLVREPRQPRDSEVEVWLAPSLEHLPVRMRIVQHNGDQIDQQLGRMP